MQKFFKRGIIRIMNAATKQSLAKFFSNFKETTYKKRDIIYPPGEVATHIFYIKTGYVKFFLSSEDGQEFIVRIYHPSNMLAFIPISTGIPIEHTYAAITDVTGVRVPKEQFLDFLKENPEMTIDIMSTYMVSMNATMKRLEMILMSDAKRKLLVIFAFLAEQVGKIGAGEITVPIGFTHQELANFTGLTRETVTLELNSLKQQGLIEQEKKFIKIKDIEKLKEMVYF